MSGFEGSFLGANDKISAEGTGILYERADGELVVVTTRTACDAAYFVRDTFGGDPEVDNEQIRVQLPDGPVLRALRSWVAPDGRDLALLTVQMDAELRNEVAVTKAERFVFDDASATVELDINVEMPPHMRIDGVSESRVHRTETVTALLGPRYPWSPPTFFLRENFPRDLPHLQPGPLTEPPRPCLIDGNEREYFFQFGLVELGVFNRVHPLVLWLRHAAEGALIDRQLDDLFVFYICGSQRLSHTPYDR